jgi:8-oxo-dGTP pyrophosphatase MutT (NUDIX family)
VLVPIVDRADGLTVLLTQRASHLKNHAGQISFPGGRIEGTDEGPLAAALRETEEEIGLSRDHVTFAGYLEPHLVLTGFWVTPVVGFVQPGFGLELDRSEVESTFEVPLLHILDAANHKSRERSLGSAKVLVYDIPYGEHHIWGATAGMLLSLYRLLNS